MQGGWSPYALVSAATTNATSLKATPGSLGSIICGNIGTTVAYLKLYNKASAPTVGTDVPVHTIMIPGNTAGAGFAYPIPAGLSFSTGIAFADHWADDLHQIPTAVGLDQVCVNLGYSVRATDVARHRRSGRRLASNTLVHGSPQTITSGAGLFGSKSTALFYVRDTQTDTAPGTNAVSSQWTGAGSRTPRLGWLNQRQHAGPNICIHPGPRLRFGAPNPFVGVHHSRVPRRFNKQLERCLCV